MAAPITAVQVDHGGVLQVPPSPTTVGWWSGGAVPGTSTGHVVLVGHVDSATAGLGTLASLRAVHPGDPVTVTNRNGHTIRYTVRARRSYLKARLPSDLFTVSGRPELVLITCGGRFDSRRRSYDDNVVVYAIPLPTQPTPQ